MDPELTRLVLGLATPVMAAVGLIGAALAAARGGPRRREPEPEPDEHDDEHSSGDTLGRTRELDEYIRKQIADAVKPLHDTIADYVTRDRIWVRFVQRLYWWDDGGRHGDMPRFTFEEQKQLDIDWFPESTRPKPWQPPTATE